MIIKVKTLTGKEIELDIDESDTVWRIKEKVEEQTGVPPVQQRLIYAGRQMTDDRFAGKGTEGAAGYNVAAGAVLHLVLALRGGR